MATFNYRIHGKVNPGNIRMRVKQGDLFDYEISTGLKCRLEHWSKSKQIVKNIALATYKDEVNKNLRNLKSFIEAEYFKEISEGNEISQAWLKRKINEFFDKPDSKDDEQKYYLTSFVERFIEGSRSKIKLKLGRPLSERTLDYYSLTLDKLRAFENSRGSRIKFKDICIKLHEQFVTYLRDQQHLNPNTIGFYISKMKLFCREAEMTGIKVNQEYKSSDFFVPSNETKDIYLNPDEINNIFKLDLEVNDKLDKARDWLIIGVWTGLRVSDLLNLTNDSIKNSMIHITNRKTGIPVIIPLHPQVKSILDKREGEFPKKISDQRFNDYIKIVCKLAGLTSEVEGAKRVELEIDGKKIFRKVFGRYPKHELVSSHICRRSFATNHYGKLDTLSIMKITGHKTESQFLEYLKITPSEHAKKLESLWEKESSES